MQQQAELSASSDSESFEEDTVDPPFDPAKEMNSDSEDDEQGEMVEEVERCPPPKKAKLSTTVKNKEAPGKKVTESKNAKWTDPEIEALLKQAYKDSEVLRQTTTSKNRDGKNIAINNLYCK